MITSKTVAEKLEGFDFLVNKASYYFNFDGVTVRVSDHLPCFSNWSNNENSDRAFFVFVGEMDENKIQKHLEENFSAIDFDFIIVENEEEIELASLFIKRFSK